MQRGTLQWKLHQILIFLWISNMQPKPCLMVHLSTLRGWGKRSQFWAQPGQISKTLLEIKSNSDLHLGIKFVKRPYVQSLVPKWGEGEGGGKEKKERSAYLQAPTTCSSNIISECWAMTLSHKSVSHVFTSINDAYSTVYCAANLFYSIY